MYEVVTTPRGPNPTLLFKGPPGPTLARWKIQRSWRKREKEVVQEWNRFPWRGERQGQKAVNLYHSNSVMVDADMARVPIGPRMANPPSGLYPIVRGFDEGPGPHPWFRGSFREDVARVGNREGIMDYQSKHVRPDNLVRGTEPTGPAGRAGKKPPGSSDGGTSYGDPYAPSDAGGSRRSSKKWSGIDQWRHDVPNTGAYDDGPESAPSRHAAPLPRATDLPNPTPPSEPIVSQHPEDAEPSPVGGSRRSSVASGARTPMSVDSVPGGRRPSSSAMSVDSVIGGRRPPSDALLAGTGNRTPGGRSDARSTLMGTAQAFFAHPSVRRP